MPENLKEMIADYGIDEALKACAELIGEGYLANSYESDYIPGLIRENLSHYWKVLLHHQIVPSEPPVPAGEVPGEPDR
jgi:hypothetical protein